MPSITMIAKATNQKKPMLNRQFGFTLIELMVVIAILGILVAIAIPNYRDYVVETKRTDMMTELQSIGSQIEAQKIAMGNYRNIALVSIFKGSVNGGVSQYPIREPLYDVSVMPINTAQTNLNGSNWLLTATPISTAQMAGDGDLTFNFEGIKCHDNNCGLGDAWRD